MRELLQRWAALQPAWCHVDDERAGVMADVGTPLERLRFEAQFHRLGQYEPHIFASVFEAIEAQGWMLVLIHNPWRTDRPRWGAYINTDQALDHELVRRDHDADTPVEAALSAYVAALQVRADRAARAAIAEQEHGWREA